MPNNYFQQGKRYEITKGFTDANGASFVAGKNFTYLKQHFLPYDEEYTLEFQEAEIVLHERAQSTVLNNIGEYFATINT